MSASQTRASVLRANSAPERHFADVFETHTAVVFFVGDRAYKLKKAVDLGFLDFTTLAARQSACEREIALNSRFSPDVYLGVGEFHGPHADTFEPIVVMRRMPQERRLTRLIQTGVPVDDVLREIARLLAAHHAKAPGSREVNEQGTRNALLSRWEANFTQIAVEMTNEQCAGDSHMTGDVQEIKRLVRRYLAGREELFEKRIGEGRVVDGHGDLRAEDIFCLDDGPRILDCLEFDDSLRYVDGLDDAAFLAMDLEVLGAPEAAVTFFTHYSEFSGDPAPSSLRHHYVAYRAFVRAKVSLIQARQGTSGADLAARRLITAALSHLRTSAIDLILVGGLPGSGKSTLSGAMADRLGVTLLSSDRIRKELAGIPPERSAAAEYGEGLYTAEWTAKTYAALLDRAGALLAAGESVVVDATWLDTRQRAAALHVAERTSAALVALHCQVPDELATRRLSSRSPGVSDADPEVAAAMRAKERPWPEAVTVDTSGALEAAVGRAMSVVRPYGSAPTPVFRRPYMLPD